MILPGMNSQTKLEEYVENSTPLISNFNDRIRPVLDAVDKLHHLKVMDEGIQLPTIVVVGDQSSGKSSILESLAGISLPRGQGICTRVPLIMRLQNHSSPKPKLHLEFHGKEVPTDEASISEAISSATDEIAGNGKCISNTPLTLVVNKKGVPDLTMVDLTGITRVHVHGQPEDIYEQINNISFYIEPKESIILNVLSVFVDFPSCELIRKSQKVDRTEGLLEKVTADDVNIGLGYVCVRNRIGDATYEEIHKSIVGVPVLAQKLVQVQAVSFSNFLPDIVKRINENEQLNNNAAYEIVEKEKMDDYSCNLDYINTWIRLMLQQQKFKDALKDGSKPKNLKFEMLGDVEFGHLQGTQIRLVDNLALYLLFTVQNLANKDMEQDITSELVGGPSGCGGIERMLEESPSVSSKRVKLNRSIKLLIDSNDVVAKIMDRISVYGEGSNYRLFFLLHLLVLLCFGKIGKISHIGMPRREMPVKPHCYISHPSSVKWSNCIYVTFYICGP
ncbi:hypothetical protein MKX01_022967 [Papaver californicum]|nr:hypothetical protein MKX01_022967 [Papaver californicum]